MILGALLFTAVLAADVGYSNTDGKPACNEAERAQGLWPNNFDSTRYWSCEPSPSTAPAAAVVCANGLAFDSEKLKCVPWSSWQWHPYQDPPSQQVNVGV